MSFTSKPVLARAKDAFYSVLEEVRDPGYLYDGPAYVALLRLLTMNGKLHFQQGLASLMLRETALFTALVGRDDIKMVSPDSEEMSTCNILVAHSSFGKLSLYERNEITVEGEILLGGLKVEDAFLDAVDDDCVVEDLLEQQERQNIEAILCDWEIHGCLAQKVNQVIDWVDREESLYLYIGRGTFARSDAGGNTLNNKPDGLLRRLQVHSLSTWKAEERLFIVALHLLFLTGSAIRFEEFNGRQLTATRLRKWLVQKLSAYSIILGEEVPQIALCMPLLALATQVGQLAVRVNHSGWVRYRRINGITFAKRELLLPPQKFSHSVATLPALIGELAGNLAVSLDEGQNPASSLAQITRAALHFYLETGSSEYIHQIIERIVLSAIIQANADYGMSSSIRAPGCMKGTAEQRISGVLNIAKSDFYCCVLPHPQLTERVTEQTVQHILYSSALRMEFNRWHFLPGNFPREEIPLSRHYYFPPLMPDIAEWSDLRHGGHSKAGVRYSIRAPGAPLWREPFMAYQHAYRGCYDVRVVRIEGSPFGKKELQVATSHCNLMDVFWKTMQQCIEEYNIVTPVVTAYTKEWYENAHWKQSVRGGSCFMEERPGKARAWLK